MASIDSELASIKAEYSEFITAADEYLSIETQRAEAPLRFATSLNAFIIDGWVPSDKYDDLESKLKDGTRGQAFITKLTEEVNEEDIPVELENPGPAKPFELLIDTFATPNTGDRPASVIFITFPLFYGIMLGDVGYGIIVAALSLYIMNKFKTGALNSLGMILLYSGVLSILFGIIFGEFSVSRYSTWKFTMRSSRDTWCRTTIAGIHLPVHRLGEVQPLLILTFAIGILHILTGLVIGSGTYQ